MKHVEITIRHKDGDIYEVGIEFEQSGALSLRNTQMMMVTEEMKSALAQTIGERLAYGRLLGEAVFNGGGAGYICGGQAD
ncbi:MAG TPA: hypothetical protein VLL52_07930 [Anaerolineae bacterium]|nr:hypothetical protein [Anaerolineae bacterium]